jgi:excisionase family DNA binding protein
MTSVKKKRTTTASIIEAADRAYPVRPDSSENDEIFLTPKEAAAYLRVSKSYLDKLRVYGGGPKFLRFGKRKILYRKADLDFWAAQHRFGSTSEYASDRISPQDVSELPANTKQQRVTKTLGYNSD